MKTSEKTIAQLEKEIEQEIKAMDFGVNLGVGLILVLSLVSLALIIGGFFSTSWDISDYIFKPLIAIINICTTIACTYGLVGKEEVVVLFIDKVLGLNEFKENRKEK